MSSLCTLTGSHMLFDVEGLKGGGVVPLEALARKTRSNAKPAFC